MQQAGLLKQFIKSSAIFFIGSVLSKAISIFMLPLYTSRIPTADMGYYDISITYITIVTSMLFFDIWVTILRFMYDGENDDEKAVYVSSGCIIFAISSVVYIIVGISFALVTSLDSVALIFVYGLFMNINNIFTFLARGYQHHVDFAISGIINTLTNVCSNLLLILTFNWGYQSLYVSGILGASFQMIYLSCRTEIIHAIFRGHHEKSVVKTMLLYTLPLCINSVAYWLITSYNRIVINRIYGDSANGIYAIGSKFAVIISLVTMCFTFAWQEVAFSEAKKLDNPGRFYSNACNLYCTLLLISIPFALLFVKVVFPFIVFNAYQNAYYTIPLFLLSAIFSAISTFIGNIFYAIKNTKIILISMLISALFNVIISYPLVKSFGLNGANLATTLSFILNILVRNKFLYDKIKFALSSQLLVPIILSVLSGVIYIFCDLMKNFLYIFFITFFLAWFYRDSLDKIKNFIFSIVRGKARQIK